MIKALIFDCFGVLYWDDLNRLYNLVGVDKFQDLNDLMHASDHGYISDADFVDQVAVLAGVSVEAVKLVMHEKQSRNDYLIKRVAELKKQYKTSLLSNLGYGRIDALFTPEERDNTFNDVLISGEVGLIKPSADLYELALERLGVAPDEVIFIDDRMPNIEGAERLGMKTILFTTNEQFEEELGRLLGAQNA